MIRLLKKYRKQRAIYWQKAGVDEYGAPIYNDPVEIFCRWEDKVVWYQNERGEVAFAKTIVYLDFKPNLGDRFKLGALDPLNPPDVLSTDVSEVVMIEAIPDLKAKQFLYRGLLK